MKRAEVRINQGCKRISCALIIEKWFGINDNISNAKILSKFLKDRCSKIPICKISYNEMYHEKF